MSTRLSKCRWRYFPKKLLLFTILCSGSIGEMYISDYIRQGKMDIITNDQCKETFGDVIIDSQICIESDTTSACSVSAFTTIFSNRIVFCRSVTQSLCIDFVCVFKDVFGSFICASYCTGVLSPQHPGPIAGSNPPGTYYFSYF